eukprot:UN02590
MFVYTVLVGQILILNTLHNLILVMNQHLCVQFVHVMIHINKQKDRLEQLRRLGHGADKIEFILMGGTFLSLPEDYRDYFVRNLHDALSGHRSRNCAEAIHYSEQSHTRCVGLTIETRPDYCQRRHLHEMLSYGCTRLELGVQSTYEDVARDTNRGHTVKAVAEAI